MMSFLTYIMGFFMNFEILPILTDHANWKTVFCSSLYISVLAVDDRHVAFCEYNGSVARQEQTHA
jgi:hypothetical protein